MSKDRFLDLLFVFLTFHHVLKQDLMAVNEHSFFVAVVEDLLLLIGKRLQEYDSLAHRTLKLVYEEF